MKLTRREAIVAAGAGAATVIAGAGAASLLERDSPLDLDALQVRVLGELSVFTSWLERNGARGFVGEVGWPGEPAPGWQSWNELGELWYEAADRAGLWVSNWASGEWWGDYQLASYRSPDTGGAVEAMSQATVVERHPSTSEYLRGVAVAGGAFGFPAAEPTSRYSNAVPGEIEVDYHYDGPSSLAYLADRGIRLARVEFRWERIQPRLGEGLEPGELGRLVALVDAAGAAGIGVVLDLHNYGAYYLAEGDLGVRRAIGSPELSLEAFIDVWLRLSAAFESRGQVVALGLMNEPADLPGEDEHYAARGWETASSAAVAALRAAGEERTITISGYQYSSARRWSELHPQAWIDDDAILYEAHHYWDLDNDSTYELSYDGQLELVAVSVGASERI